MSLDDALQLFMKDTPVNLTEKEVNYSMGMSKMTIVNE